jgi:hypothetical protein
MTETTPPADAEVPPEGNLGQLDDATYFDSLGEFPGAVDENGQPVEGLFDDVVDARESKQRAADAAERGDA